MPTRPFTHALFVFGFAGTLLAADPFVGTWRLDPARSSGTIPKDETVIIQERGLTLSVEVRIIAEKPLLIKYVAPINGGLGHVEQGPYDGVSLRRIDSHSIETTYLSGGKEIRSTRGAVTSDGRTMTSTGSAMGTAQEWIMVFRKEKTR
jgi:hypothetical protein